ncbi:MAG: hypothetical protein G01um10148_756 [Parcubacteria group bacterium Gr01-1014_8]|nr:MAG: hypothetical protein G01um10148_756 [Parcubacteria group bacterium Gr01-1014_8]
MPQYNFDAVPEKKYVDTVHLRIIHGLLNLVVQSGATTTAYVLQLPLAKKVAKATLQQVEEIETKNNVKFDDRLPHEPMPTPFTFENPKDEEKKG